MNDIASPTNTLNRHWVEESVVQAVAQLLWVTLAEVVSSSSFTLKAKNKTIMADPQRDTDDSFPVPFSVHLPRILSDKFLPTLWTPLLFLLVGQTASSEHAVSTNVTGTLGKSVTLPLNISVDTEIEHVTWTHLQKAIVIVHPGGRLTFLDKSYQSRVSTSNQSYSLSISNLKQKDEGLYNAQINKVNTDVTTEERFTLQIYEQLQKPQVTVNATMSDSGSCNVTLMCFVERAETSVRYRWTRAEPHASESHEGSTFTVSWMLCDPDLVYTCSANNPVSQNTSRPVSVQELCTAGPGAFRGEAMRETVIGTLGESVTLPLKVPANQSIKKVVWRFNTSVLSKESGEVTTEGSLAESEETEQDRVLVSGQDYSLTIHELKMEDAGPYSAYMCSEVTSMKHFTLRIHRPEKSTNHYIIPIIIILLALVCVGIWCIWKRKRKCSSLVFGSRQAQDPADTSEHTVDQIQCGVVSEGYEKLGHPIKAARRPQPEQASSYSADSTSATAEEEDTGSMQLSRRDLCHLGPQEERAFERQTQHGLITRNKAIDNTVYSQVSHKFQGERPDPQKNDNSLTVYCSVQKPLLGRPPPEQNDESPEIPTYENST